MTDFRMANIPKQEAYDLLRDWIKLVARHTNPDQDISELLGWLWKLKPATPDPITGLVPCGFCENPKKLMEDGYYQVTPNTKWLPDIGDLVCTPSGEYAIFAIDGCEDDTFLCQGMTACPMCGRKLRVAK